MHQPVDSNGDKQFDPHQKMTRGEVVNEMLDILEEIENSMLRSPNVSKTQVSMMEKLGEVIVAQRVLKRLYYVAELINMDFYEEQMKETNKAVE